MIGGEERRHDRVCRTLRDHANGEFTPLLTPGWVLTGEMFMWDVMDWILAREAAGEVAKGRVLFGVLDDAGQAFYTSGHCVDANDLDGPGAVSALPERLATCVHLDSIEDDEEEGAYVCNLNHPQEFPIRLWAFRKLVSQARARSWTGRATWDEAGEGRTGEPLIAAGEPSAWPTPPETRTYVLDVPVTEARDAIAAFPQGYFAYDLQPAEHYEIAGLLADGFGYAIKGLGASFAGYARDERLTPAEADRLEAFLLPMFDPNDAPGPGEIARRTRGRRTLYLNGAWG